MNIRLGLSLTLMAVGLQAAEQQPNIIFILADDLGWGDLGCYGNPQIKTPHLDRLAQQGTLFTQFYAAAAVCSPSRAAFFTGQYPGRLGIHGHFASVQENTARDMPQFLDPALPNVASLLKRSGYATSHVGKWHLGISASRVSGSEPNDRAQPPTPAAYGFDFVGSGELMGAAGPTEDPYYRAKSSELFVDETIAFIRQHRDRPFYAQLWALVPHAVLNPTPEQLKRYAQLRPGGPDFQHSSAAEIYYASVTDLDFHIGRLLAALDELGGANNTVVIFTSDNGPEDIHVRNAGHSGVGSAGPFRGRKRSLYEGGIRMPFIVRWPGHIRAGQINDTAVLGGIDLLPTIGRLAAISVPSAPAIDGEDVSTVLLGGSRARARPLRWEARYSVVGDAIHQSPQLAIRDGDWKLLVNHDGTRVELHDVRHDPMESDNLAAQFPERVVALRDEVLEWSRTLPSGKSDPGSGVLRYPWPGRRPASPARSK